MSNKSTTIETTTHVAACAIQVNERIIQRCLVCGEKLADNKDVELRKFWKEGLLVRAEHGFLIGTDKDYQSLGRKLPKDFCIDLVEL